MTVSVDQCVLVIIEGLGCADGQLVFCFPEIPDCATSDPEYVRGLEGPPQQTSGRWDIIKGSFSVGRYRITFGRNAGSIPWLAADLDPISTVTDDPLDDSSLTVNHARTNTAAGIVAGKILYCGRETWKVNVAVGAATSFTITARGFASSPALAHSYGAEIKTAPPTLIGRRVVVYEIDRVGGSYPTTADIALRGCVFSEPAAGIGSHVTIEVFDRFIRGLLNESPKWSPFSLNPTNPTASLQTNLAVGHSNYLAHTIGNESGGYFVIDAAAFAASSPVGGYWVLPLDRPAMWGSPPEDWGEVTDRAAYLVLYSKGPYPAFRYYDVEADEWIPSANPAVIMLNVLMSIDGTNYDWADAYRFDLGSYETTDGGLHPGFSLGVLRDDIDLDSFLDAQWGDLYGVEAHLWLGGRTQESIEGLAKRLLEPCGYVCGCGRQGLWKILRLSDVYPGDAMACGGLMDPRAVKQIVRGRALEQITIECDTGPDGKALNTAIVTEESGLELYPDHVGQHEVYKSAPYPLSAYDGEESYLYSLLLSRIRRLGANLLIIEGRLRPSFFSLDIGGALELFDPVLDNPRTGVRLTTGEVVYARGTSVTAEHRGRTIQIQAHICKGYRTARMSPSATVTADLGGGGVSVSEHAHTHDGDGDGKRFSVGDKVVLCDSHFVPRTATTGANVATVTAATHEEVSVGNWLDAGGSAVTPAAGDELVFAGYDDVVSSQIGTYAYCADGGAAGTEPSLGAAGDDPYIFGD